MNALLNLLFPPAKPRRHPSGNFTPSLESLENRRLLTGAVYPLPAPSDDFTGTWIDPGDFQFDLEQNGNKVTGRVIHLASLGFSDDIRGKADGNNLSMTYKFPGVVSTPDGVTRFKFKATLNVERNGNTFTGLMVTVAKKIGFDSTKLIDATRI